MPFGSDAAMLGIDLGTSAVKTVLVDMRQRVLAQATTPLHTERPHPGWSEQAPEAWWRAVLAGIERIRAEAGRDLGRVRAVGLSGQMHGLVLLDGDDRVLRPAMLWNDSRAALEVETLAEAEPEFARRAGAAQSTSFWPAKLLWLRRHEPATFARIRRLLPPKDYLRLRLTGLYQSDPCDAAGTLLLDEAARRWSHPSASSCGVELAWLPELVEGDRAGGPVTDAVADDWGIGRDALVAGGGGDAATGAIGIGAIGDGDAYVSLGTSAQLFVTTGSYRPSTGGGVQAFAHALSGLWFQAAAVLNGAGALAWATRLLGHEDPAALLAEAQAQYAGPRSDAGELLFLPYLTGERTPHNDPSARGVLFGLTPSTTPGRLVQAVLEGVACSLADALDCLAGAGTAIGEAAIVGGGARSAFWTQIIADILGIPMIRHAGVEAGPAFGAARLARLALTGEAAEAVCAKPPILDVIASDPARHEGYRRPLARYRALYGALRPEFRR